MPTEVTHRGVDGATIVYIDGDLTTNTSPEVEEEILEILEEQAGNLIINVEKVNFIASTGLRVILALGKKMSGKGQKLMVCSMNATTKSVFNMSGFSKLFPTFDTEDEAIRSQ